ncbi:hypothetical protein PSYAC_28710, partial [Pseudomonas syringae pv. actinidiae str. M302091]
GAAIGMAGGGDLEFIAGQEVHGQSADFLAAIIGDRKCFAVLAFLRIHFLLPSKILRSISKARKVVGVSHTCLPINTHSHPRLPS